ncbi:MAG: YggS family pyridoxal phosphate-dependent enzyme [Clostridia bacterium]|nr:YggS family pyridoxal phosphate-dependent enzyme [Clostridia bacterium]
MTERLSDDDERRIAENIEAIRGRMARAALRAGRKPEDIELMAVTKTMPAAAANAALRAGVRLIGENRVQELCSKLPELELDGGEVMPGAKVHLIGHLQTNKIGQVLGHIDMLESVDSAHLARELSRRAVAEGCVLDVLMEINIGGEDSKTGIKKEAAPALACEISQLPGLRLRGLMAVPPFDPDKEKIRPFFAQMKHLFIDIRAEKTDNRDMNILSMGMSSDFETAIEEGSTLVRIGTAIFGERIRRLEQ